MYVPRHFSQDDTAVAHDLVRSNVGFDLPITELQSKWKFNQNRGDDDRAGVIATLEELGGESKLAVAATMRMLDK